MNKCIDNDVRDMLPDLLHGALSADAIERAEAHLASCEECKAELQVLRAVKSAAVFAPTIDVDQLVRRIPPYRKIVSTMEAPARARPVSWLVAAALLVGAIGVGSMIVTTQKPTSAPPSVAATQPLAKVPAQTSVASKKPDAKALGTAVATQPPHTHSLALAADVEGLSDGNLVQLMNDMNRFDALPATESDPVISVDSGY